MSGDQWAGDEIECHVCGRDYQARERRRPEGRRRQGFNCILMTLYLVPFVGSLTYFLAVGACSKFAQWPPKSVSSLAPHLQASCLPAFRQLLCAHGQSNSNSFRTSPLSGGTTHPHPHTPITPPRPRLALPQLKCDLDTDMIGDDSVRAGGEGRRRGSANVLGWEAGDRER